MGLLVAVFQQLKRVISCRLPLREVASFILFLICTLYDIFPCYDSFQYWFYYFNSTYDVSIKKMLTSVASWRRSRCWSSSCCSCHIVPEKFSFPAGDIVNICWHYFCWYISFPVIFFYYYWKNIWLRMAGLMKWILQIKFTITQWNNKQTTIW